MLVLNVAWAIFNLLTIVRRSPGHADAAATQLGPPCLRCPTSSIARRTVAGHPVAKSVDDRWITFIASRPDGVALDDIVRSNYRCERTAVLPAQ